MSVNRIALVLSRLASLTLTIVLILTGAGLIATHGFLHLEYTRENFPPDPYGLSTEERIYYAGLTLEYLFNSEGTDYLEDIVLNDGTPIYTGREMRHLADVKYIVSITVVAYVISVAILIISLLYLFKRQETRPMGWRAVRNGGSLTIATLALIGLFALGAWDTFFEGFHSLLFAPGSWRFRYGDMLIRLFPERFWMDAALGVALVSGCGALAAIVAGRFGDEQPVRRPKNSTQ